MVCYHPELNLTVMTLNLRFGRADDGVNSWENRKERYVSLFQEYKPDFIGMQEANDFQIDFFNELLEEYRFIGQRVPSPSYWQDNIIFFNKEWECSLHETFFLSDTPTVPSRLRESKWPRQCVLGTFKKGRVSVMCVNTHFDFLSTVQEQSAKIILKKISDYHNLETSVFITGDFNALPGSPGYIEFISRGGFQEVFHGKYTGTYHGFTGQETDRHIDWILYRGPLELAERKRITDKYNGGYPSDHFPILAKFRIRRLCSGAPVEE